MFDSIFDRNYSEKACEFQCHLQLAKEECGCVPWNYPQIEEKINEICDGPGTFCFENAMQSGFGQSQCDCLSNCDETIFSINENKFKRNHKSECDPDTLKVFKTRKYIEDQGVDVYNVPLTPSRDEGLKYDVSALVGQKLR